ncbi:HlyD family efflux transporter periplasmic adaptor subunit [uncultured Oscillibacter sp.]|uniref:HlyD family efflux transporter periplasmic adaptor subunit n=1 Tax=uncultured Oscillibacter sp. TaxID=876091 RepID=UPI0025D90CAD|nr:HlyD family efflux transporter periplasmic adaptor subunit [uncultured Oscillibacter sp.]
MSEVMEHEGLAGEQAEAAAPEAAPEKPSLGAKWKAMPRKKRRKIIRWTILLLVVLAAVVILAKLLGGKGEAQAQVVTDIVQYGSITSTVEGSGLTKSKNSETITLTTSGTVLDVLVAEGQQVTAGTPLFVIESEAARTAVDKARKDVEGYEKQLNTLYKDIAGLNLAAGYPGKLMECVTLNPGDTISKDQKVATLADDTRLRLEQYYSYAYAGDLKAGQTVNVSVPALMTSIPGTVEAVHMVSRITPEGSKLFSADILIKNDGALTAEMMASATVTVNGETVYPYEPGKLEYYRTGDLKSTVNGTVISSDLVDYLQVSQGQVLVRIDGEDSESEIFTVEQSLEDARKTLETAQKNLDNCNAVAPIDGTVIGLMLQQGQEVEANTAVITIADTSTITVDATVDERNVSYVKAGMMVSIDQWGNSFMGTVESVSLNSKAENGVASYPMVITVDNSDGTMMTGSYVNYTLTASENDNCLVLPIQSVKSVPLEDGTSASVVFVKADARPDNAVDLAVPVDGVPEKGFWPVVVEIGISDDYNVEIKTGVEEGMEVFTTAQTTVNW